jgi:hypothetical protein
MLYCYSSIFALWHSYAFLRVDGAITIGGFSFRQALNPLKKRLNYEQNDD